MNSSTLATARPDLSLAALLRLSCAYALATNGTILMPLIVGALMRRFGAGEDAATGFAALEIAGIAISCAVFPRWIARAPRRLAWIATLGTLLAQAAGAWMPRPGRGGGRGAGHGLVGGVAVRGGGGEPVQPRGGRARVGRHHPGVGRHR